MVMPKKANELSTNGAAKRPLPVVSRKANTEMKVYIRVRPFSNSETAAELRSIVKVIDKQRMVFDPKENDQPFFFHGVKQKMRDIAKKQNKEMKFQFDRIYGEECTNDDVYNESIKDLLPRLLEGYSCSVFVYGATGAGKTFTMIGNETCPGITYLTMLELYAKINELKDTKNFDLVISYLEVYNENVHDLLNPGSGPLQLREDPANGVVVANMKLESVFSADHLLNLLQRGNSNRTQHPTDANAESSRSHAVFQVFLRIQDKGSEQAKVVKLTMIDLAGSERGAATNYGGIRFKEGSNINRSLLALGNCINKLADGVKHIPYRDSKLTRLLKDSLGGNCQTVMIACVSPAVRSYEDTYNTLKYANRAKNIKMALTKNVMPLGTHDQYKNLVQELQTKIRTLENEISVRDSRIKEYEKQVAEQNRILHLGLQSWKDKISTLFEEKKQFHQELLALESNEKILTLKIKQKNTAIKRTAAYNSQDAQQDIEKMGNSIRQLEGRIQSIRNKISQVWDSKIQNEEKINALMAEMEENGARESLTEYIELKETEIGKVENALQYEHANKINESLRLQNETMVDMLLKLVEQNKQYHLLLCGYNKMTNTMMTEHTDIQNMVKGFMKVSWAMSPSTHLKRKNDQCSLSLDNLRECKKPCLITKEDNDIIIPRDNNDGDEDENVTFIINDPISKFNAVCVSPQAKQKVVPKRINKRCVSRDRLKQLSNIKGSHSAIHKVQKVTTPFKTPTVKPLRISNKENL